MNDRIFKLFYKKKIIKKKILLIYYFYSLKYNNLANKFIK